MVVVEAVAAVAVVGIAAVNDARVRGNFVAVVGYFEQHNDYGRFDSACPLPNSGINPPRLSRRKKAVWEIRPPE